MERLSNLPKRLIKGAATYLAPVLLAGTLQSCGPGLAGGEPSSTVVPSYPTFQDTSNGLSVSAVARCGEEVGHGLGQDSWILNDPIDMQISVKGLIKTPFVIGMRALYPRIAPREVLILYAGSGGQADVNLVDGLVPDVSKAIGVDDYFNDVLILQANRKGFVRRFQVVAYKASELQIDQPVQLDREAPLAESLVFSLACP